MSSRRPYALVFKTHMWDDFIKRQLERYTALTKDGDVFACVDETNGPVGSIEHSQVLRHTNNDLIALGLADRAERGSLIWWNTDYPNYLFAKHHPDYEYYIFVEYDTCINRDIDELIRDVAEARADFVALPNRAPKNRWVWTAYHVQTYEYGELHGSLNCISILSNRAVHHLMQRRLEMSRESIAGGVPFWPGNEVFVATEIEKAGFTAQSLEKYGNADGYEWYPPHLEEDLGEKSAHTFLHPVLDRSRYMKSLLKFSSLPGYFYWNGRLGRALKRFPEYRRHVPAAFVRRAVTRTEETVRDNFARRLLPK